MLKTSISLYEAGAVESQEKWEIDGFLSKSMTGRQGARLHTAPGASPWEGPKSQGTLAVNLQLLSNPSLRNFRTRDISGIAILWHHPTVLQDKKNEDSHFWSWLNLEQVCSKSGCITNWDSCFVTGTRGSDPGAEQIGIIYMTHSICYYTSQHIRY